MKPRSLRTYLAMALLVLVPRTVSAQDSEADDDSLPGAAELGAALADMLTEDWVGAEVAPPTEVERPRTSPLMIASSRNITVHGVRADGELAAAVLGEVVAFADYLELGGFPAPAPDGGLGGDDDFDLYLAPTPNLRHAAIDTMSYWQYHDTARTFAIVDPTTSGADILVCAVEAYALGVLLSKLPAEAEHWRRAFAAWLTWRWTGRFGCADGLEQQQSEPGRSWIHGGGDEGAGGGLLLAMLSERHDAGTGLFLRELLQVARQRTRRSFRLRASPDLWQAVDLSVDIAGERLFAVIEEFAITRYFMGTAHPQMTVLEGLGPMSQIQAVMETSLAELPFHSPSGPTLGTFGTAYMKIDVQGAPPESRLRVWLRGEYGVEWSLTASRLDASGQELARLSAPSRRGDRRSYLPIELTPDTTHVLVAVTNLSHRLPDADEQNDPNERSFRWIVSLVQEDQDERE